MALTVPGGYYSHVALHSRCFRDPSTSVITIASLSPLPGKKRWHALMPGMAYGWAKKKGEGWLISVTFIGVVLVAGLLAGTWILECLASPLMASPSHFLAPTKNHVSRRRRVDCTHLAETSLSKARKVLRGENLSQGILWPVSFLGTPISAPQASLPIIRPGNSRLESNMAVLSP